jgi:uncharacterized RDD family membrane protein YckC
MATCTVCSRRKAVPGQTVCRSCRRRPAPAAPRRIDVWIAWLVVALAYAFILIMGISIFFPNLDVHEGWLRVLLYAVCLFLLLRAYIAFRARSRFEAVLFITAFLIVLAASV